MKDTDGLRNFMATGDRGGGYDGEGILLLLQGLRSTRNVNDFAGSGGPGSGGRLAIFGEGVETKMVLCISEWWGEVHTT